MEEQKNEEMKGNHDNNSNYRQDCGHFGHFGHHCGHKFACLKGVIALFFAFLILFIGLGIGFRLGHFSSERHFCGYGMNGYGENYGGCPMMNNVQGAASYQAGASSGFTACPMIRVQESGQIPVTVSQPSTLTVTPTSSVVPVNAVTHGLKK
jgi:hypothetical protein